MNPEWKCSVCDGQQFTFIELFDWDRQMKMNCNGCQTTLIVVGPFKKSDQGEWPELLRRNA